MLQTELLRRLRRYAMIIVVAMTAMLFAGCGSDEEIPVGEYYIGPDKDGWYTFYDKYSVYDGHVFSASSKGVIIDTYDSILWLRVFCLNLTDKDCARDDVVKIKIRKFKINEGFHTCDHGMEICAEVELLSVKKP